MDINVKNCRQTAKTENVCEREVGLSEAGGMCLFLWYWPFCAGWDREGFHMVYGLGECEHAFWHMQITHSLLLSTLTLAIVSSVLSWPKNRMALKGSLHLSTRAYTCLNAMMPKAPMHLVVILFLTIGCRVLFSKFARVVPTVDQTTLITALPFGPISLQLRPQLWV